MGAGVPVIGPPTILVARKVRGTPLALVKPQLGPAAYPPRGWTGKALDKMALGCEAAKKRYVIAAESRKKF